MTCEAGGCGVEKVVWVWHLPSDWIKAAMRPTVTPAAMEMCGGAGSASIMRTFGAGGEWLLWLTKFVDFYYKSIIIIVIID